MNFLRNNIVVLESGARDSEPDTFLLGLLIHKLFRIKVSA